MVVTANSQNSRKNYRRNNSRIVSVKRKKVGRVAKSSPIRIKRGSLSIFSVPFICAFFLFTLYINLSDIFWQIKPPKFSLNEFILPEENTHYNERRVQRAAFKWNPVNSKGNLNSNSDSLSTYDYIVRTDDTYSIIARKFSVSIDSILSVNDINQFRKLKIGEQLTIPNISGIYYRVKKGDTLTSIGLEYNIEIEKISLVNKLLSTIIHPKERLFLPGVRMEKEKLDRVIGSKFIIPAAGVVKNNYGSYTNNITELKYYNNGIDILNRKGTAVYAAKDGIVQNTLYNSYYG
ncbi:MAG: LysM peptidoglycan-binding domain-containing protein, partial [bacterium]|nr:LysM peptidoglycan-binding domain-containing protein [bacterium]